MSKLSPSELNQFFIKQFQYDHLLSNLISFSKTYGREETESDLKDYLSEYAESAENDDPEMSNILYTYICEDLQIKPLSKPPIDSPLILICGKVLAVGNSSKSCSLVKSSSNIL